METDSMKLLILCLTFVILIFYVIRFGDDKKKKQTEPICDIFWFFVNFILLIGFIIGIYSPPQPTIYMIACFAQGFYVIVGVIMLAVLCFVLGGVNETATRIAADTTIAEGVLLLSEAFICGLIAYFSFKVWKLGG